MSYIEIHKQQFIANLCAIKQHIGNTVRLLLPVKANAYGHGLALIAALADNYVDYFGVSCFNEGKLLRIKGIVKPILVFGGLSQSELAESVAYQLDLTISSLHKAKVLAEFCQQQQVSCRVHLKLDTGMQRIGVQPASFLDLFEFVNSQPRLKLIGIYSHLASTAADSFTQHQLVIFAEIVTAIKSKHPYIICHIANSGATAWLPQSHFDMVRPGLLSYGYLEPSSSAEEAADNLCQYIPATILQQQIKPCLTLKSTVCYFKVVAANSGIGYNHTYITSTRTRIVTVAIGHGDGYRRILSNRAHCLVRGIKYPIAGIVCMDMLMLDIGSTGSAYIGDEVVLLGQQGQQVISAAQLAELANTNIHELLVGFSDRLPRLLV